MANCLLVTDGEARKWLSKAVAQSFTILLVTTVSTISPVIASQDKFSSSNDPEPLQTEIGQRDIKIIEQLVAIAERNSPQVRESKAAMGLNAFVGIMTMELSPTRTTTNSTLPDSSSVNENSFSFTITIDPIKLVSTFVQLPIMEARWNEAKHQKRVAVMQYYIAYLQARQTAKIAAYRMQKFTQGNRIANLDSQGTPSDTAIHLANPNYVAAATEMLNRNTRERMALEELAACVGLSSQAMTTIINGK